MKRNEWMAIIATSFLMFALCLSATAQNNKPVYNPLAELILVDKYE